jgi:tetratricopeptide (TPR) repeat protein
VGAAVFRKRLAVLGLTILLLHPAVAAQEHPAARDLPVPARMVLHKVNSLLQDKQYRKAAQTLRTFQAEGGPLEKQGSSDSRGYHHPEIYFALGNSYLMQEQYPAAAAAYRKAVSGDASHHPAWLNLARALNEMKQHAEAGRCFAMAYDTAQKKEPAHLYYSAVNYLMGDEADHAIEIFERLFASHPAAVKPQWKENMVSALLSADQPRRALPYIRELAAIYSGPRQIQWQEILLYHYVRLDMHAEALDLAHQLTRQAPTESKWWKALTHIYLNRGRYEEALAALITYSFLTPLSPEEKKLAADLSLEVGVPVKAAPLYENCLQKKFDPQLLRRLVLAYRQLGLPHKALERIDALSPDTTDINLLLLKAELHYALEQFEKAAAAYRRAAGKPGAHRGHAWLMAGYAAWQMRDWEASKKAFVRAKRYEQEQKAAAKALQQLEVILAQ